MNFSRIVFFLLICSSVFGQKHNIQNYTTKEGLPGQIVNGVFQDKNGYIWFATQSGVCLFNGKTFQPFEPDDRLVGIDATGIIQDAIGRIWIATNANGVFVFDFKTVKNYTSKNGLASDIVRFMFIDNENTLWILTSSGVSKLKDDKLIPITDDKQLFKNGVLSMAQAKDGSYWFGTQGNWLVRLKNGTYSYFNESNGLVDNYIFSLKTHGDSILIGTTSSGLWTYSNDRFSKIQIPEIENAWISNVVAHGETLYIVSSNGLVQYRSPSSYQYITESNGLSSNDLYFGLKDRENNIWLASGNGVSLLRNESILSFDKDIGLSDNKITSIASLNNGKLVVGTYGYGLNVLNESSNVIQQIQHPELMNVKITAVAYIPFRQEIWVGAEQSDQGIIVLDAKDKSFRVKKTIRSIRGNELSTVTKISAEKDNSIWVATFNAGIFRIRSGDSTQISRKQGLPSNEVYTFEFDNDNNLLLSLYQKGLFTFDINTFKPVGFYKGAKDKIVLSIAVDRHGNILLGNKTEGLSIISNDKFFSVKTADGLLSNSIQAVVCDGNNVWVGSNLGLNKITFTDKFKILKIESYTDKTGFLNSEIQQNGLLLTKEHIWIGSSTGLSSILKNSPNKNRAKPLIELQSIKLHYEVVDWEKKGVKLNAWGIPTELLLGYEENNLTFTFNALTPSGVQYSYILEGQDKDWSPYSEMNEVTFTNIAPGQYSFKIKAINNLGIESHVLSVPITIKSPFWQTWWFRISFALGLFVIVFLFIRYREKRFKAQQAKLEQLVNDRTKEAVNASERAEHQRQLVEQKNKEIVDSISYAKRIQTAMLPAVDYLRGQLRDIAVFYQPKDIVAGDFYWYEESELFQMLAVADCTGHGVPGAMVSVVCYNALNRSVREYGLTDPGQILDKTREIILLELSKHDENVKDGMDISLLVMNKKKQVYMWSGANNPLWIIRKGKEEIEEIKADKQPIGVHINASSFTTHALELMSGDTVFLFTDGYSDQFGGKTGKKFKSVNLKKLFSDHIDLSMPLLESTIISNFQEWKDGEEQVDDVCVIAIRI